MGQGALSLVGCRDEVLTVGVDEKSTATEVAQLNSQKQALLAPLRLCRTPAIAEERSGRTSYGGFLRRNYVAPLNDVLGQGALSLVGCRDEVLTVGVDEKSTATKWRN